SKESDASFDEILKNNPEPTAINTISRNHWLNYCKRDCTDAEVLTHINMDEQGCKDRCFSLAPE
ncbi:MAG: hypothetical protein PVI90_17115, partial [Desulfobacteraceae bacterium]